MELSKINWSAAAVELADEHRRTGTPKARRALAAVSSLRGRFSDDFTLAAASTTAAIALEPLDPIHQVRDALVRLRFGDLDGAIARLDALPEAVADLPLVLVVKSLAIARRGEPRTARNIADRALQVDARHAGARFLHTETNLAASVKGGLDKLGELPRGAAYDAAWADLLARLAILRPNDTKAVAAQLDRGVIGKGTRADTLARTVIAWSSATIDDLVRAVEAQPADSRAEQLALALLADKLDEPAAAVKTLRALHDRVTERPAIRRALVAALTRLAIDEAANDRFRTRYARRRSAASSNRTRPRTTRTARRCSRCSASTTPRSMRGRISIATTIASRSSVVSIRPARVATARRIACSRRPRGCPGAPACSSSRSARKARSRTRSW